jgi:hypothetical protein
MTTKRFRDIGFKLRIAWSAGWGIVAVLLIVSWVRSYWWDENLKVLISNGHAINVETCSGTVSFNGAGQLSQPRCGQQVSQVSPSSMRFVLLASSSADLPQIHDLRLTMCECRTGFC